MDDIIRGVTDFNNYILTRFYRVMQNALTDLGTSIETILQLVEAFYMDSPYFQPFKGVDTHHKQLKYCKENLGFVVSDKYMGFI